MHIRSFCIEKGTQNRFLIYTSCFYIGSPWKSTPKVAADFISEDEHYEQRNVDASTNEAGIISGIAMNLDWQYYMPYRSRSIYLYILSTLGCKSINVFVKQEMSLYLVLL